MAFGSKLKEKVNASGSGEGQTFESYLVDNHEGVRIFRILPALSEDGKILDEPVEEYVWREYWAKGIRDGTEVTVRVVLDWRNPFSDPLWKHISERFEKGSKERKGFRTRFAINVLDKTPVLYTDDGQVVYPDGKGNYTRIASTSNKELPKPLTGDAKPLNKVRLLVGSSGAEGGNHDLQKLLDTVNDVDNPNTGEKAKPHHFDLKWKITGKEFNDIRRNFHLTANYTTLAPAFALLPRYDLESWVRPWPHDAISELLEGRDLNELIEEYRIELYPKLMEAPTQEDVDFTDPNAYEKAVTKGKRKKAGFEE